MLNFYSMHFFNHLEKISSYNIVTNQCDGIKIATCVIHNKLDISYKFIAYF